MAFPIAMLRAKEAANHANPPNKTLIFSSFHVIQPRAFRQLSTPYRSAAIASS